MIEIESIDGLPPVLKTAMIRRGFSALTKVQEGVLRLHSEGKNLRISSQTGSGKTVAMGLILGQELENETGDNRKGPLALLVAPTRELAMQIQSELDWLYEEIPNLKVAVVTGGRDIVKEKRVLARRPQILVGTPGRLLDHARHRTLNLSQIKHVVLDEADQMLDMGFKDELDEIVSLLPEERRSHLISATFPREVSALADRFQPEAVIVAGTKLGDANPDIEHVAYRVRPKERYGALVNSLLLAEGERCLIFVRRRLDASELAEMLAGDGFSAMPFSGDLSQAQRSRTLHAFRKGVVNTLVATDVAARGIDVADISSVIHKDLPLDSDTYTHRSGRTGRAGKKGRSVMLVPPAGERRVKRMLGEAKIEASWMPVPKPKKIEKTMVKRARREVHALMKAAPEFSDSDLDYAEQMLTEYQPKELVAQLLELAVPKLPTNPVDVAEIDESMAGSRDAHGGGDRKSRGFGRRPRGKFGDRRPSRGDRDNRPRGDGERGYGRGSRSDRQDRPDRGPRPDRQDRGPRPDRQDRGPRPDRQDRGPRPDGQDRGPRPDGQDRGPRPDGQDRPERGDRSERSGGYNRDSRPDRGDKPAWRGPKKDGGPNRKPKGADKKRKAGANKGKPRFKSKKG
jgi:ATP-dependent RNA helicase DeaD